MDLAGIQVKRRARRDPHIVVPKHRLCVSNQRGHEETLPRIPLVSSREARHTSRRTASPRDDLEGHLVFRSHRASWFMVAGAAPNFSSPPSSFIVRQRCFSCAGFETSQQVGRLRHCPIPTEEGIYSNFVVSEVLLNIATWLVSSGSGLSELSFALIDTLSLLDCKILHKPSRQGTRKQLEGEKEGVGRATISVINTTAVCAEVWSSAGTEGRGKREIPEKTRLAVASSGTIHSRENPGVTRPGIEPCSSWWEASRLTAQPPRPLCVSSSQCLHSGEKCSIQIIILLSLTRI
ncbi:hypothetical protein PR048_014172 [Dryococelus australis]|uniref:Uncharacterized protein n=1 Tax=Dryococelus australis TaxID=614101 RepID=A0ABQ9HE87_9NEOP|nr:hypothetical protein PR048_014172 [Dryococelus australis]